MLSVGAACASPDAVVVPAALVVDQGRELFRLRGEGVQRYVAALEGDQLAWRFEAPEALLFDWSTGEHVGAHGAGPVWVIDGKGSVTGQKAAAADAPDAAAVPWLLVDVTGPSMDRIAQVTHVQRVDTWGGRAPRDPPTTVGESRAVRYEATYVFLGVD